MFMLEAPRHTYSMFQARKQSAHELKPTFSFDPDGSR